MRRHSRLAAAVLCITCFVLVNAPPSASQTPSMEYQVKATFLYNFAQFIQWPSQVFPDANTPFTICVAGDPFDGALEKIIEGETLNGRRFAVRRLAAGDNVQGCHIVYVSRAETARSMDIIKAAANLPILTVGESADFINFGGIIRFTDVAHRVRFEVNPDAADRATLRISSRLLRVADIARPRQRAGIP